MRLRRGHGYRVLDLSFECEESSLGRGSHLRRKHLWDMQLKTWVLGLDRVNEARWCVGTGSRVGWR